MNVFTFTGNLGKDCRTNTVGGNSVCNFSVAVTEGYGDRKKTHWIDCALWGKQAESLAPYLLKGAKVAISGEAGLREAKGEYPAAITCRVATVTLLGSKPDGQQDKPAAAKPAAADFDDSDLPF
jgi:single-strand DNA-binding protein